MLNAQVNIDFFCILKFSEEFTKINPKQEVPVLLIDNLTLMQSVEKVILKIIIYISTNIKY